MCFSTSLNISNMGITGLGLTAKRYLAIIAYMQRRLFEAKRS
jgi:hypothetical protein